MKFRWHTNFGVVAVCMVVSILAATSYAHPGRMAVDGCHYCRSNCERWGEVRNQRHCHNQPNVNTRRARTNPRRPTNDPKKLEIQHAHLVRIIDGDTIEVRPVNEGQQNDDRFVVRLANIDAPERGQPWGNQATAALASKVKDRVVKIHIVTTDRYGRKVGNIWLAARDINREMVREGHAWVYDLYLDDKSLLEDEKEARDAKRGLWGQLDPINPVRWRRGDRSVVR